ncbi:hypothetical protein [Methylorubrum sp. SB2]|uniref:hypothetical protein n=1 Tax=Methylorubrum subtropicum TaxID=3138812 RepID=UPI00313CFF29
MLTPETEQALTKALERRNAAQQVWVQAKNAEAEAFQAFRAAEEDFARRQYAVAGPLLYLAGHQCRAEMRHVYTAVITPISQDNNDMKTGR